MIVKDFFENDINRNIETVIKADDKDNIANEVEEYVVTNEISKKIAIFFNAYNENGFANGVWISVFFGSGKSHLLKIISYVLASKKVEEKGEIIDCGQIFAQKIEKDDILKGDILRSLKIPSESILFNIDQHAQITGKKDDNAILSVFYKVFYDHLGYYGFQPHMAEFEMWLDSLGQYEIFKIKFQEKSGKNWLDSRRHYFITDTITEVLGEINGKSPSVYENILNEIENKTKQSIEDFCLKVHEYIKSKPAHFRLNFFVDEVGQYISDNTKLMLNLQTIAETLATKTKGASWILVTSQEDMEKVVGDMSKSQQNDFSKIMGRFKVKISLTSANVEEVIEKRLLKKNATATEQLAEVFKQEGTHLDTLLSFSNVGGMTFKGYKGKEDFINKVPFVPYQFDLFKSCRIALSNQNAFQGKHASVGERSILGVFQQVLKNISGKKETALVSFDMIYDGMSQDLRSEFQNSINIADKNLGNPIAVKILKFLLMVKYVSGFKTTKRNISVLMIDDLNVDLAKHDLQITEALNLLELQSYIQRNNEVFEFLTDDEKDVEREIKNTDLDALSDVKQLGSIFFDEIIKDSRLKYIDNKQDYEFCGKIDGSVLGREKELEIEIVTPLYHSYQSESLLLSESSGRNVMRLIIPENPLLFKDLRLFLQTDKYVKQNQSTSNSEGVKRILAEKSQSNALRKRHLTIVVNKALAESKVIINGSYIELNATTDGRMQVINGFQHLVKTCFPNLRMLGATIYSEETIKNTTRTKFDDLFKHDDKTMSEAEIEILSIIKRRKQQSDRTSLLDLRTAFSKKPFGWYQNALWTLVARLYKRGKIEIKKDANILENEDVLSALLNSAHYGNTLLEVQQDFDNKAVKDLIKTYTEAFNENCSALEAKDVGNAFKSKLKDLQTELLTLLARKREYPFLSILDDFMDDIGQWVKNDYSYFVNNQKAFADKLLDAKEDLIDPIKRFINGEQASIYDSIKKMLEDDRANFDYIEGDEIGILNKLLTNPKPFAGSFIRDAKIAKDELTNKVSERVKEEKLKALGAFEAVMKDLKTKSEFQTLDETKQNTILLPFQQEMEKLNRQQFIATIRDIRTNSLERLKSQQLNEMIRLSTVPNENQTGNISEPVLQYVRKNSINIHFAKSELQTEADVNEYVEALRKAYIEQIKDTKRIAL
jgi:hypothetical protein